MLYSATYNARGTTIVQYLKHDVRMQCVVLETHNRLYHEIDTINQEHQLFLSGILIQGKKN